MSLGLRYVLNSVKKEVWDLWDTKEVRQVFGNQNLRLKNLNFAYTSHLKPKCYCGSGSYPFILSNNRILGCSGHYHFRFNSKLWPNHGTTLYKSGLERVFRHPLTVFSLPLSLHLFNLPSHLQTTHWNWEVKHSRWPNALWASSFMYCSWA